LQYKQATLDNVESLDVEYKFLGQIFDCSKGHETVQEIKKDEEHVKFVQRDACNLPSDLGMYHCAIAANLLCRLPDPEKFLKDIGRFILPGGFLILLSPYSWLQDYTPKDKWLGGKYVNGERVFTIHTIEEVLSPWFEPYYVENEGSGYDDPLYGYMAKGQKRNTITIPFCLRTTRRRFEYTYSEMSVWIRKQLISQSYEEIKHIK
jgi:SAM-dependent methyltransferase